MAASRFAEPFPCRTGKMFQALAARRHSNTRNAPPECRPNSRLVLVVLGLCGRDRL
jgi:hypothetical protein